MNDDKGFIITTKEFYKQYTKDMSEIKKVLMEFREENIRKQDEIIAHQKVTNGKVKQNRADIEDMKHKAYKFAWAIGGALISIVGFFIVYIFF